jgi:hypothetical protein
MAALLGLRLTHRFVAPRSAGYECVFNDADSYKSAALPRAYVFAAQTVPLIPRGLRTKSVPAVPGATYSLARHPGADSLEVYCSVTGGSHLLIQAYSATPLTALEAILTAGRLCS